MSYRPVDEHDSKIKGVHQQLDVVKDVMRDNVEVVIKREAQLTDLQNKSIALSESSAVFEYKSKSLKWKMCRDHWKPIGLLMVVLVVLCIILYYSFR